MSFAGLRVPAPPLINPDAGARPGGLAPDDPQVPLEGQFAGPQTVQRVSVRLGEGGDGNSGVVRGVLGVDRAHELEVRLVYVGPPGDGLAVLRDDAGELVAHDRV